MKMDRMVTGGNVIIIDDIEIEYGRVPSSIVNDWGELVFYFATRQEQEKHDEVISKAINRLIEENEDHGVDWRVTNRFKDKDTYYYQLTVVAMRIRDSY